MIINSAFGSALEHLLAQLLTEPGQYKGYVEGEAQHLAHAWFTDMGPAWRTNCGRARAGLLMARVFCDSSLHPARGERRPDHGDRMANCRQPPQRAQVHRSPFRRG